MKKLRYLALGLVPVAAILGACTSTVPVEKPMAPASQGKDAQGSINAEGETKVPRTLGKQLLTAPMPANVDEYGGILVGKDLQLGHITEGVPVVRVYSDPLCPYCARFDKEYNSELEELAKEGKITLVYQPNYRFQDKEFSTRSLQAFYWVAANVPEKFVDFHREIYAATFDEVTAEPRQDPDVEKIYQVAQKVGMSETQIADMRLAIGANMYEELLKQGRQQFTADGFTYIPAVWVDGNEIMNVTEGGFAPVLEEFKK